jgi:peptidoglycan/xylan/chitin deacetylase (PgdA/CDA1 family)
MTSRARCNQSRSNGSLGGSFSIVGDSCGLRTRAKQTCHRRLLAKRRSHGHLCFHADGGRRTAGQRGGKPYAEDRFDVSRFSSEQRCDYGFKEGLPRLLEVFDRHKITVTSHMVAAAVDLHPALAKEIVQRGHEAAGHGQTWTAQFSMTPEEERASYQQSIESIERATGTRPVGFNAFWLRGTPQTLEILQSLGFLYHIDDVSRDEPFLINVRERPFAVVPALHTPHERHRGLRNPLLSTAMYADDLKAEFDALYAEAGTRRRMMSVSAHDRIAGRPSRSMVLERFITYAQSHPASRLRVKMRLRVLPLRVP